MVLQAAPRSYFARSVWLASCAVALSAAAQFAKAGEGDAAPKRVADAAVNDLLTTIRQRHDVPALWGAIVDGGQISAMGAVGVRKHGDAEPVTVNDKIHLGSCTKAMTATLAALLVEEDKLAWDSTLGEVFTDVHELHADYRAATLTQLLTHTSGAPANPFNWYWLGVDQTTTEQRRTLLKTLFGKSPRSAPGSEFFYSNAGYAIAGLMLETVTGESWEDLIRQRLLEPLGMTQAGFGPPSVKGEINQPWGHVRSGGKLQPSQFDNAPALGPAGTVHCTLADWGRFISLHLRGPRGEETLLQPESFDRLHEPAADDYACGWVAAERPWGEGRVLTHTGSNTMWFTVVWMSPKRDFAVLAATNFGGRGAGLACDNVASALIDLHLNTDRSKPTSSNR